MFLFVAVALSSTCWLGVRFLTADASTPKEMKSLKQVTAKQENATIKAAQKEFKTKEGFENWMKEVNYGDFSDETKIIAAPEDDGFGWVTGAPDASGNAGTVVNEEGKVMVQYSFDNPSQVTTIGKIRSALPN